MLKPVFFIIACLLSKADLAQSGSAADSSKQSTAQQIIPPKLAEIVAQPFFTIYPNPAKNKVSLQVSGFEPGIAQVKITDTRGKLWKQDNRLLIKGREEIAMFLLLAPGIYFISVIQKNKVAKKKMVIL